MNYRCDSSAHIVTMYSMTAHVRASNEYVFHYSLVDYLIGCIQYKKNTVLQVHETLYVESINELVLEL